MVTFSRYVGSLVALGSILSASVLSTACSKQSIDVSGLTSTNGSTANGGGAGANPGASNPGGGSSAPATVSAIAPTGGLTAGATLVTVTGTAFATGTTVTVGGVTCGSVSIVSSTQLTCTTGAHAAGAADVVVTSGSASATLASGFNFTDTPTISSISPNGGALAGGTVVTITGVALSSGATITIGGVPCSPVVMDNASQTQMHCTITGPGSGASNVVVTNNLPSSGGGVATAPTGTFTFQQGPTLTSISPTTGTISGGNTLTVNGANFLPGQTGTLVSIGGVTGSCTNVTVVSSSQITCKPPAHAAGAVNVQIINPDTQLSGVLTNAYTYASPTITGVSPATGPMTGGTSVTITGTGFANGATVTFAGTAASCGAVNAAGTSITCTTPSAASGSATVALTDSGGTTSSSFYFSPPPTVSGVTPPTGGAIGGATVTITGTNFVSGATAKIGGTACASTSFVSSTSLTCVTPKGTAGAAAAVQVTNPDAQSGSASGLYTYQSFAYVARSAGTSFNNLVISPADGTLTFGGTGSPATGAAKLIAIHPSLPMAYVVDGAGNVDHFAINPANGVVALTGSAAATAFGTPNAIAATSNGKFVYVSDGAAGVDSVTALRVATGSGALSIGGSAGASDTGTGLTNPMGIAIAPSGVYVVFAGNSKVCSFSADPTLGDLTQIGTTCVGAVSNTTSVAVDGAGKYVYAIGSGNAFISRFGIQGNGSLASLGADTALTGGTFANGITSAGSVLYVINNNATIGQYTINSDGTLTSLGGVTVTGASTALRSLVVDPTGKYAYVVDTTNKTVIMFTVGAGGALTQQGGSPFSLGSTGMIGLAVTPR